MEFRGQYPIPAPREIVWAALNDPQILQQCIPGCEQMEKTDETHFRAQATLKIGPVKATFKASIELANLDPPSRCTLKGEGQGGVAGFARGDAEVLLEPDTAGTVLTYKANAAIGGKLAQIGQRLIDGAAKQIADDFFSRFSRAVGAVAAAHGPRTPAPEAMPEAAPTAPTPPAPTASPPPPLAEQTAVSGEREGVKADVWVVGLIGVIVALLAVFGLMTNS